MKKYFFVSILLLMSVNLLSQDVALCEDTYRLAEEAFAKKDYKKALTYYNQVMAECGEAYSNCKSRVEVCKNAINKTKQRNAFSVRLSQPECDGDGEIIYLIAPGKKELKAEPKEDWIDILEYVNDTIWLSVDKNPTPYQRSGTVEISTSKGQKSICQIRQLEGETIINTSREVVAFSSAGGKSEFEVKSNAPWGIEPLQVDWISVSKRNNETISVTCKTNRTVQQREVILTLYTLDGNARRNVKLVQELGDTYLEVTNQYLNVSSESTTKEIQVESNSKWDVTNNVSWISVKKEKGEVKLSIEQNSFAVDREAEIIVSTIDNKKERIIRVSQLGAKPYMTLDKTEINGSGNSDSYFVGVSTNVPNWKVSNNSTWCRVRKTSDSRISISVMRNDNSYSRSDQVTITGGGLNRVIDVYQPNRGYIGRYNDYFDANGDWRVTWFSTDVHIMTAVGMNISTINARWKPVEVSLLNLNLNYDFIWDVMDVAWEPVVRGFLPVSRDGRWAAFVGMGAHVGFINYSAFLLEFGMECHWSEKYSSRMFFKYNGTSAIGMSFDIGAWIW